MNTIIEGLRYVLGEPNFWVQLPSNNSSGYTSYQWDYGAIIEYVVAAILLLIVVSNIFRFLTKIFGK